MKKIVLIIFLVLISAVNVFSQNDGPRNNNDFYINPSWEFYSSNFLSTVSSGRGNTGVASLGDISNTSLNPATLDVRRKFEAFAGYTYKTKINYNGNFTKDGYLKQNFPSFFLGIGYRFNKYFQTGFIYKNGYSFNDVIQNVEFTNETGAIIGVDEISTKYYSNTFSVPMVLTMDWFRIGVNLNTIYHRTDYSFGTNINYPGYPLKYQSSVLIFYPDFGMRFNIFKDLAVGINYTPAYSDSSSYSGNFNPMKSFVQFPQRLSVGSELSFAKNQFKVSFDYNFITTSSLNLKLKDQNNINVGLEWIPNTKWSFRTGFFTQNDFRLVDSTNQNYVEPEGAYTQYFLTLGMTYKYRSLSFSFAGMDSHLINKPVVAHTKFNIGVCFDY